LKHDVEVAKKLLKKIDDEKADTKKAKKTNQTSNDKKKKKGKEDTAERESDNEEEESSEEEEGKSAKKKNEDDDARFGSELYRHRKALTYTMHKRLSQRVKLDHMQWFAFKAEQLDRGQEPQRNAKSAHHQVESFVRVVCVVCVVCS
jgi:hypothetical protein